MESENENNIYQIIGNFVIPGELPDLNTALNKAKHHWAIYAKLKKNATKTVGICALAGSFKKIKEYPIDIDITFYCKNKKKDKDNIMSYGIKCILDGLKESGIIEDDSWRCIGDIQSRCYVNSEYPHIDVILKRKV